MFVPWYHILIYGMEYVVQARGVICAMLKRRAINNIHTSRSLDEPNACISRIAVAFL